MSAPRTPCIYVAMLTLVSITLLAWSSIAAPCIEIGFFWASAASTFLVAFFAWRTSDRISQGSMLLVYIVLAASITLMVTSLSDLANFTFLGEQNDAESGLLLGGFVAFLTVGMIATRLSSQFPMPLSMGSMVACLAVWGTALFYSKGIDADHSLIISMTGILAALIAFALLCHCKKNLNKNQHIAVIAIINVFIMFCVPSATVNLSANVIALLVMFLSGLSCLVQWQSLSVSQRIAASMLLFSGFSGGIEETLKKVIGVHEPLSGIPTFLFALLLIALVRLHRNEVERGFYWVALFTYGALAVYSLAPETSSDSLFPSLASTLFLFIFSCVWYATVQLPQMRPTWKLQLRQAVAACATLITIGITYTWFTAALTLLVSNSGPARILPQLKNTPLWPGDNFFVRLVMKEESLWSDETGLLEPGNGESANDYLKRIRPRSDRFSRVIESKTYGNMQQGIDEEDIGVRWVADKDHFYLKKVDFTSPAGKAGLNRGDRVMAINNKQVRDIKDDETWEQLFGKWKAGTKLSMNVVDPKGTSREVLLEIGKSVQDQPLSKIINTKDGPVGYLYLEGFSSSQFKDIRTHFIKFKKAGVHDLVLDLRYNGGGIIDNASLLSDLIGGQMLDGKPFVRLEHSARYHDRDSEYVLERLPESPHIRRVVVLTTKETCSASEAIISGLKPHMPIIIVGSKTCGKPYSMQPLAFGDNYIMPVTARVINSSGEGNYARGIRPDVPMKDDLTHQLGDLEEGMLKKALEILEADNSKNHEGRKI